MPKKCVCFRWWIDSEGAISDETSSVGTPVSHTVDVGHHRGAPRLLTRGWRHLQVEGVRFCLLSRLVTPCFKKPELFDPGITIMTRSSQTYPKPFIFCINKNCAYKISIKKHRGVNDEQKLKHPP